MASLAELVWNALDADADKVAIRFDRSQLDGLERIRVQDNGTGIPFADATELFGSLGGSWKKMTQRTAKGRSLHGKSGKGRFIAFSLGGLVEWKTTSQQNGSLVDFTISGSRSNLEAFELSDPHGSRVRLTGTEVVISNLHKNFSSLTETEATAKFANYFALYLSEYPGITIDYDGTIIDPKAAQRCRETYELGEIQLSEGRTAKAELTIIEWKLPQERALYLCDSSGISLYQVSPGIRAPGYEFTAYLRSDAVRDLDKDGLLIFDDSHPDVITLVDSAKSALKAHFRERAAEDATALVEEWKESKVYPYEGDPQGIIEEAERQVFDVVALNINSYLSDFDDASDTNKRFTFTLVRQALQENPQSLRKIFTDVLHLPKERQDDLAELLGKTSLPSIISAARVVSNRLDFLRGLEILLFDKDSKQQLLERDQLHKILANETWIFGEQFHLTSNEDTLNEVLEKHLALLGQRSDDESPVTREDSSTGRIDLMLAQSVPQPRAEEREYLVVELKRPKKKVDSEVLIQVESYAIAVAKDERFRDTKTKWIFWAISNEMTDDARRKARQRGRPEGLTYDDEELRITVWAKSWGQIIQECKARLDFFKKSLEYEADRDSAKSYLRKAHDKYLPKSIQESVDDDGE